jgi:hypothetical protein
MTEFALNFHYIIESNQHFFLKFLYGQYYGTKTGFIHSKPADHGGGTGFY